MYLYDWSESADNLADLLHRLVSDADRGVFVVPVSLSAEHPLASFLVPGQVVFFGNDNLIQDRRNREMIRGMVQETMRLYMHSYKWGLSSDGGAWVIVHYRDGQGPVVDSDAELTNLCEDVLWEEWSKSRGLGCDVDAAVQEEIVRRRIARAAVARLLTGGAK